MAALLTGQLPADQRTPLSRIGSGRRGRGSRQPRENFVHLREEKGGYPAGRVASWPRHSLPNIFCSWGHTLLKRGGSQAKSSAHPFAVFKVKMHALSPNKTELMKNDVWQVPQQKPYGTQARMQKHERSSTAV